MPTFLSNNLFLLYGFALAAVMAALGWYSIRAQRQDAAKRRRAWDEYRRTGLHLTGAEVDAWLAGLEAGEDVPPPERRA